MTTRTPVRLRPRQGTVRSQTTHVVHEIGIAIVDGRFAAGAILPGDAELMDQFRVSRTVLREALRMLAAKGLIVAKARVGTRVRPQTDWNLFDADVLTWYAEAGLDRGFLMALAEMRMALEPQAAALAAERHTAEQLEQIFACVERMANAETTGAESFVAADLEFHLAVSRMAANPFLNSISTLIEVALVNSLRLSSPAESPQALRRSVGQHRAIAKAIADRNAKEAAEAMRVVIAQGMQNVRRA